jgi:hypothetical protein
VRKFQHNLKRSKLKVKGLKKLFTILKSKTDQLFYDALRKI